jgi:hypothetical protein
MTKEVKSVERVLKKKEGQGEVSKYVDYIMYIGILFVLVFGFMAYKKLAE